MPSTRMARVSGYLRIQSLESWMLLLRRWPQDLSQVTSVAIMAHPDKHGADLIAHAGAVDLSEVLPDGLDGACFKTELDDGQDVVDVQVVHASFVAEFGFPGVNVAQLHRGGQCACRRCASPYTPE